MPSLNQQGREPSAGLTIEAVDPDEALCRLMEAMGFEIVDVGGEELLRPLDEDHPEYGKCCRAIDRALRKAATDHGEPAQDEGRG